MIHEFNIYFCVDPESGTPYFAKADSSENLLRVELEEILSAIPRKEAVLPVLVRVDDLRPEINLSLLYKKNQSAVSHQKVLVMRDSAGRVLQMVKCISHPKFPFVLSYGECCESIEKARALREELGVRLYAEDGTCSSEDPQDDIMEFRIVEKA